MKHPSFCPPASVVRLALALAAPLGLSGQSPSPADSIESAMLTLVLSRQPELAALRAAATAADARLNAAGSREAPSLGVEIEDIPRGVDLPQAGQIRLMLEREFLTGARRAAAGAVAGVLREEARLRLDLAERSLAATVRRDLVTWRGGLAVAARLAAEDSLLQEAEAGLMARFSSGEARYVDVLRLRTERLRARSDRAGVLRAALEGRRRLEGLVAPGDSAGQTLDRLLGALAAQPAMVPAAAQLSSPPEVDSLLLAAGALHLADLRVERAGAEAARVRASRRPVLTGGLGLQRFGDAAGGYTLGPSLRASLSLPFLVRGSTRAMHAAADLAVVQARAERSAFASRLRTQLWLARDRYAAALERVEVYGAALLAGAAEEREGALGAYRAGELSLIELLDFERALARAEIEGLRAAIEARVALADLYATAAGPWAPPAGSPDGEAGHD